MGMINSIYASIFGSGDADVPDPATGLTPREKEAITASWALLAQKKEIRKHGVEFFVMLFETYPYMQPTFNAFKGMTSEDLRRDKTMYSHALTVMYSIGNLVENLDDAEQLVLLVNKIAFNHLSRDIGIRYFEDLKDMFPKFLVARAGEAATPFVQQSWTKFLGVMNSVVQQKADEMKQGGGAGGSSKS
ncbi:globin-like [Babylonia areolata]|uniref:globin-like n=1 Tax=Babylonia areolata TaxID=304850 RepID=UPI003FD1D8F3